MAVRRMAMGRRAAVLALWGATLVFAGCDAARRATRATAFRGVELRSPDPAPPLRLATATGDTFDLAQQRGRVVLLFFGYTHCPDVCPTTLADWARVRSALGDAADQVRFVFVSVDPERDTPAVSQAYASSFDSSFVGLTADDTALTELRDQLHIVAQAEAPTDSTGYGVAHSAQVFLIDPEGRVRLLYPFGSTPRDMAEDISVLLDRARRS